MLRLVSVAAIVVWLFVAGTMLSHATGRTMEGGCPVALSQGIPCLAENLPGVINEHMQFVRDITQVALPFAILGLFVLVAVPWQARRAVSVLRIHQRLRTRAAVHVTPQHQRQRHWLALHARRDPDRFSFCPAA